MQIVVAGAGKIGETICLELANEGHNILLIEQKEEIIERLIERSDISGIKGNAIDYEIQMEADIPNCDLFIAVTGNDEINLLASILADRLGAKHTIAGVSDPQYGDHMNLMRRAFGISQLINPKLEAAKEIAKSINSPSSVSVESFAGGRVNMHQVHIDEDSPLIGMNLIDFRNRFSSLLVCAVERQGEIYIPGGSFVLNKDDNIQITGLTKDLDKFYTSIGKIKKRIKNILIIGAGEITNYLCGIFERQHKKINVTVIEKEHDKAIELSADFPHHTILEGDGTSHYVLNDINFASYDAIIALTGVDEENIMVGLLAAQSYIPKIISKVNRTEILPIIRENRLQTIITPKSLVSDQLLRIARAYENALGSKVETLYRIFDNRVEVLEFVINKDSRVLNVPIKDLKLKPGILIIFILRQNQIIFPTGADSIQCNDHIVIASTETQFDDIEDILAE